MSIVNFSIPQALNQRVAQTVREKGFASRAELFRFATIYFLDIIDKPKIDDEERNKYLTDLISQKVIKNYKGKKVPSLKEQLADV